MDREYSTHGAKNISYRDLMRTPEEKGRIPRIRSRLEENTKMYL
jgi:hypothetical protein